MNAVEKRLAEQIGALLIDNAKMATTVEMQATEISDLKKQVAQLALLVPKPALVEKKAEVS